MTLEELLQMDGHSAIDWLVENKMDYELAPKEPTQKMLFGVDETQLNEFCTSSRQSRQHDLGKQIYTEMIKAI
jgi:hypothetical protein